MLSVLQAALFYLHENGGIPMRKGKLYISILLGLCLCLFTAIFTACGKKEAPPPTLESISVSGETEVFIDEFDYADYTITATYSDDSTKTTTLTAENLSAEDNAKLSTVGTHALTVSYERVTCSWTVTLKNHEFAGLTFDDVTTTYDGTAKTLAVAGLPTGAQVSYDKATSYTNAGEYTVKATITLANYNPVELTATLTINKAVYDMSGVVFADKTVTYNGQAHSIEATNLPNGVTAQYTGNKQINADEYTITATFAGDSANYEPIASKTATLTIEQRELTLAFSGETTLKYNGSAQKTITVQATNLVGGDSVELTVSYNGEMIEAGEYIATSTLTAHQNYKLTANNTVKVTITRATHTVTFKQNGVADVTREVLDLADLTDIPTPQHVDGYKFTWNRKDFTSITGDITVTANKELITYKIEYVVYDGVNSESNPTTYTVESATLTLKNPTPSETFGKSFGGWFISEDFTAENKITKIEKGSFGDLKLYAYWLEYRVTDVVGGTVDYSQTTPEITIKVDYGTANLAVKDLISVSDGCTWNLYNGFECLPTQELITKRLSVSNIGDNIFYILVYHPDSDEYYSDYVLNVYQLDMKTCTFIKDGETWASGEIQEESAVNAPENPEKDGYTFNGWKVNGEFVSFPYPVLTDTTFIAGGFTPITYIVSYELNGGENDESNPETYNIEQAYTLKNSTRTGYDFKGWFTEKTFDNQVTEITLGSYGDKKFYAKWTPTLYTIEYELNGGENDESNPETYNIEQTYALKKPTRMGYDFAGWFTEKTFDNQVTEIALGSHGDKNFYAKWTPTVYTITYELNGGVNNTENLEVYTIETSTITLGNPTRAGYTFAGWFWEETFENQVTEIALGSHDDKKFYAKWDIVTYIVSYELNGGENDESNPETYNIEQVYTLKNPTRAGYTFAGWFTEETFDNQVTEIALGSYGEKKFYAKWTANLNKLKFDGNGATHGEMLAMEIATDDKQALTNNGFAKSYYHFIGWATEANGEVVYADGAEYTMGTDGEYTLYAVWKYGTSGLEYALSSNGEYYTITKYSGTEFHLAIPETYEGKSVTSIADSAFYGCYRLESMVLPDTITMIGKQAFYGCYRLTSIEIPNSVTSIGESAFYGCSSLESVVLSNGLTTISKKLFYECISLISIDIPEGVKTIEEAAFYKCSNLENAVISNSITTIERYTFEYCSALTNVTIGYGVKLIKEDAFLYCESLTNLYYSGTVGNWCDIEFGSYWANPMGSARNLYINNVIVKELMIPDDVTNIAAYTFINCITLEKVIISNSVTAIRENAFAGCSGLKNVSIPNSVTVIEGSAFRGCSNLTDIILPDSISQIGSYAFLGCSGLRKIEIPDSVTSIEFYAFSSCSNLTQIKLSAGLTVISEGMLQNCSSLKTVDIPSLVTSIGGDAFEGCSALTNITIPDRVTYIGNSAFEGCSGLTNIVIPDNVKEMGTFIFSKCSNLEKVKFSSNMTKIPMNTFYLCYKLTTIIIPKNVVEVHGGAFDGCGLKTVYYEGTKENWNTINILGNYNKPLTNATRYYYSETAPALNADGTAYDGNYWHYDESGEIVLWVYEKPEE